MIREEYIFFDVDAASKEELLDFISEKALEFGITDSKEGLKDAFLKREEESVRLGNAWWHESKLCICIDRSKRSSRKWTFNDDFSIGNESVRRWI